MAAGDWTEILKDCCHQGGICPTTQCGVDGDECFWGGKVERDVNGGSLEVGDRHPVHHDDLPRVREAADDSGALERRGVRWTQYLWNWRDL
jgi:hypothetical protein